MSSWLIQVTVVPTFTVRGTGLYTKLSIITRGAASVPAAVSASLLEPFSCCACDTVPAKIITDAIAIRTARLHVELTNGFTFNGCMLCSFENLIENNWRDLLTHSPELADIDPSSGESTTARLFPLTM